MADAFRVLYVDDEPELLNITKMFLEQSEDFFVVTTLSAYPALELLKKEQFDAIISDYQMPDIDGISFLKQLKASGNTTPFIIFTGKGREEVVIEALNEGADFYIQKGGEPKSQFAELSNKIRYAVTRRRVEEALRESETSYRNVVEDQTELICRFFPDGTHVFVNEAYCRYFGLNRGEIIGTRFHPIIHPEDRKRVSQVIASLTNENPFISIDQRIIMPDGSIRWQRWVDRAIFHSDGSLKEYQSVGRDITENMLAAEALRESEEKFRNIVAAEKDAVLLVDTETGSILEANQAACLILGYSLDELVKLKNFDLSDEQEKTQKAMKEFQKWIPLRYFKKKEGSIFPAEISISWFFLKDRYVHLAVIHDITERRQKEEALRESEEKFRSLAESSPDYIMRYDRKCRHIYMNPAALRVSGQTEDKIIGKTHRESGFDENQSQFWEEKITGVFKTGKPYQVQFEWESIDGHVVLDWKLTPEFADDGSVRSVLGVSRDITQLKLAEKELLKKNEELNASYEEIAAAEEELRANLNALTERESLLRESEEKFHTLFDSSRDALFVVEIRPDEMPGKILEANEAAYQELGYTRDELLEKHLFEIVNVDKTIAGSLMKEMLTIGQVTFETEHIKKDGSTMPVEIKATIFPLNGQRVMLGVARDVTDRKRTEEMLWKTTEDYRTIFDAVPAIIWHVDVNGKVIQGNKSASDMLGLPLSELVGKTLWDLFPKEEADKFFADNGEVINSRKSKLGIIEQYTTADGLKRWANTDKIPNFGSTGEITGVIILVNDITESKIAHDALRQVNHKLNLLSGITRHDVLNQLNIITGFLTLLEGDSKNAINSNYCETMKRSAQTISELIAFTSLYEDIGVKSPLWQNVRGVIQKAINSASSNQILFSININDVWVYADPLLERVFFNLIENSKKHGENVTHIQFSHCKSEESLTLLYEDNGAGFDFQAKQHLFERGYGKNTGYGLFLAREILSITGITIAETSVSGMGARFEIKVPKDAYRFS